MQIFKIKVADLSNDPANARKHDDKNIDSIIASLRRFGQQKPIVIDASNVVRAGNGTLEAAKRLGWDSIECVKTSLKGSDAIAYAIADNRTAELAEWDSDILAAQLSGLLTDDEALANAAGFSAEEIEAMLSDLADPAEIDEDEVPEPPVDPITKLGDLWILGEHRVLCGDSTKAEDVARLMAGDTAAAVLSDPPYGVSYVGKTKDALEVHNDGRETLGPLLKESLGLASGHCHAGGIWYIAAPPGPQFLEFAVVLTDMGIWRQTLVWAKQSLVMGHSDYHYQHEAIFYGWKPGAAHKAPPDRKQTTLWHYDRPTSSREHPTMKPVALFAKMIENSTTVGSLIYEPFGGSGTTLIAAEQLNRKCYGMEIRDRKSVV
jgi:site-specific DNA-methyltransferase (adenine-specific)